MIAKKNVGGSTDRRFFKRRILRNSEVARCVFRAGFSVDFKERF